MAEKETPLDPPEAEDPVIELKREGNSEYAQGNYSIALKSFSEAIDIMKGRLIALDEAVVPSKSEKDDKEMTEEEMTKKDDEMNARQEMKELTATLFCNRSMCHSGLDDWSACVSDAKMAVQLNTKYEKAYFRLVKAFLELKRYKEARLYLVIGFNSCPDSKFLKALDAELTAATGVPSRPKPTDFEIIEELGDGNFSKIFKAEYKPTKKLYAVKTIEKQTVERMKRRHKNIHNEILMEKRVLNKLSHPNIVNLYATFQDYGTLYYQMELMAGEVWTLIQDDIGGSYEKVNRGNAASVGCYFSLARFYLAECVDALEYMHRNGVTHRDLKPENMMITSAGHLKLVDFGTCKDLRQTDLNGQEFVGTAEYMAPEVIDSENSGPAADLWSLGIVLYQMVTGRTPFQAPSPYLSFLRIKRVFLRLPALLPHVDEINEVLQALLVKDPCERLSNAADTPFDPMNTEGFSYNLLRSMALFRGVRTISFSETHGYDVDCVVRVPTLCELAVRAVANASLIAAERISANGGVRNDALPKWIQEFKLYESVDSSPSPRRLAQKDRASIMLYLKNKTELHAASVYRLFFSSVIDSRNIRTDLVDREYIGYWRSNQGQWRSGFSGVHFTNPLFGNEALSSENSTNCDKEHARLRTAIAAINKMRPKFVVVSGNFTAASCEPGSGNEVSSRYDILNKEFRRCMARVSETIPVLYVPGVNDVGFRPTPESISRYQSLYGCDYYGFWLGGVRILVINTSLLIHPELAASHAASQHTWLIEELEQCKLCAMQVVVFSYHSFFELSENVATEESVSDATTRVMPQTLRDFWLPRFRNFKVKFLFSANKVEGQEIRTHATSVMKRKVKKSRRVEEVDENGEQLPESSANIREVVSEEEERRAHRKARDDGKRGSELKPSEILAQNQESDDSSTSTSESSDDEEDMGDKADTEPIFEKRDKTELPDGEYEESSPFSPDLKYSGPTAIGTPPLGETFQSSNGVAGVLRVVEFEDEETAKQALYTLENIPSKVHI